jgi:hypothetical protein
MYKVRIWLAISAALTAPVFGAFGDVVSSFRMPPITNYCEGLAWDGEYLWSSGSPTVYFVRLTTYGSVVSSFRIGGGEYGYSEGATWDGAYLWFSWHLFGRPATVTRVTTTGSYVSDFRTDITRIAGLAWENDGIWCYKTKYTTTGSVITSFKMMGDVLDMAWDGHYLWSGNKQLTTTGSLVQSFRLPATGFPRGTTFDGNYLWIGLERWAYQIDIDVVGLNPGSFGKIKGLYR